MWLGVGESYSRYFWLRPLSRHLDPAYQLSTGIKVSVDTKGQLEVDGSSGHPIWTWVNCWWREVGQFQASSQIQSKSLCWAVYVEPRIWNWESGSQLSSLKILDVRFLWQIQTKAGETEDHVWDS